MIKDTPKGLPDSALDFEREPTEVEKEMVDTQDVVRYMERTYPEMTSEFLLIQRDQYELFCKKQYDYGPQNIAVGTILKTPEDIKLSLLGIWFRMNDKIERMKTLLLRNGENSVEGEPVTDSFSDVSNYGVMAQVVARGKWAK
jgi:hypothetical protein